MNKRTFDWAGVEYQSPEYWRRYREANKDKLRAYARDYNSKRYLTHPETERARRERYALANAHKVRAHRLVHQAIRAGKLVKGTCGVCSTDFSVIAHHDDYNRPLDVLWLCEVHHKARHRQLASAGKQRKRPSIPN